MRIILIFFLIIVSASWIRAQDSTSFWKYGISVDFNVCNKIKSNYEYDIYGTDLVRNMLSYGKSGGIKFNIEYNKKWGFGFRASSTSFDWSSKKFDSKMIDRYGSEYLGSNLFSIHISKVRMHGLVMLELNSSVYRVFFTDKKFNLQLDVGYQLISSRNPEYGYIIRTPSTNYYEIIQVTNKRNGLESALNFGVSLRKNFEYESESEGYGYMLLRLGLVYGFDYFDSYKIISENHLNEVSEFTMDFPVQIIYFNLGLALTFM